MFQTMKNSMIKPGVLSGFKKSATWFNVVNMHNMSFLLNTSNDEYDAVAEIHYIKTHSE